MKRVACKKRLFLKYKIDEKRPEKKGTIRSMTARSRRYKRQALKKITVQQKGKFSLNFFPCIPDNIEGINRRRRI